MKRIYKQKIGELFQGPNQGTVEWVIKEKEFMHGDFESYDLDEPNGKFKALRKLAKRFKEWKYYRDKS